MHAGNHFLRTLLAISLCAIAQAAEPVASAPDAVAQPTAAAAPVANAPQAPSKSLKVPSEYRRKVVKGEVVYCTTTTIVGSRFPKQLCVNEQGLRDLIEQREANQQDLRRSQSICAGGNSCGAN